MRVLYERDKNRLSTEGVVFVVTNNVRNEIDPNNVRRLHDQKEVRRTITSARTIGEPYMPRKFPKGTWSIVGVEWWRRGLWDRADYGLVRIRTNAHQIVQTWILDASGGYDKPSGKYVDDSGYLFHYSDSRTTLGCGRIDTQENAIKFAKLVESGLSAGNIILEVV
jgi:hypothetical protein